MSACYSVQALEVSVPVEEYLHTCVDVERFLGCCQICDHYNHTWSCPPFTFDPGFQAFGRFSCIFWVWAMDSPPCEFQRERAAGNTFVIYDI